MTWTTPTLTDVRKQVRDTLAATLSVGVLLPNSLARGLADGQAGLCYLTLLYLDWLSKQFLPDTAETEWLDRHAAIWLTNADGSTGRKSATYASGTATATGTSGTILPAGTELSGSSGTDTLNFETTSQITIGDTATAVAIRALDTGSESNLEAGASLSLSTAVAGVSSTATVVALTGGADAESDDDLRARVLERIQKPPHGGSASDYVLWAKSVTGVTRAWAGQEAGLGTVTVRFMMDDLRTNGIPAADDLATVLAYLEAVRPVGASDIYVPAPIPNALKMGISKLSPDTTSIRAAIQSSLNAMILEKAEPGQTIYRSWVDEAIASAAGVDHYELTFATIAMPSKGHIATLSGGNISWT
ncbi:Uncharacterized phage protein gp47/JayE [Faunimonas pinastri]|uniref:Uncharacterized phage protein gp47/JayE n=1 Tax=Faunimonas pinastri TaxID=1855383 RepID=A0A1H9Q9C0_9HYPH|nr:baseplate J/gp47 family protein [Faunimonas pinastri]SER56745.1 Uncharacterized phage protein gp47/JayE [Faunimonas pinastri]